jgi:hypothetical protein
VNQELQNVPLAVLAALFVQAWSGSLCVARLALLMLSVHLEELSAQVKKLNPLEMFVLDSRV